jgi:hypothetical protein
LITVNVHGALPHAQDADDVSVITHSIHERRNMLISASDIRGYSLHAIDGEIGRCHDFLFDDTHWRVRYMVANTRAWLPGRKVLISPQQLDNPDWESNRVRVALSKQEIKDAPSIDADAPVSRRSERAWADYFGYARYWAGPETWGPIGGAISSALVEQLGAHDGVPPGDEQDMDQVHVRSCDELIGYEVVASNGTFGHVRDVLIDTVSWRVHKWVLASDHLPSDARVSCAPEHTIDVSWGQRTIRVDRSREQLAAGWRTPAPEQSERA